MAKPPLLKFKFQGMDCGLTVAALVDPILPFKSDWSPLKPGHDELMFLFYSFLYEQCVQAAICII